MSVSLTQRSSEYGIFCEEQERGPSVVWDYLQASLVRVVLVLRDPFSARFFWRTVVLPCFSMALLWLLPFSVLMCCLCKLLFIVSGGRALLWKVKGTYESIKTEFQFLSKDFKDELGVRLYQSS